ncbi:MAG: YigZ family protein [Clostridia bacterium]|nr:YigZ family protein [Clostridia bacterium]
MKEQYTTIAKEAKAEIIEKRSRFIATARPVATEEEALTFLNQLRQEYWDATHNVYAYIIEENQLARYSDDGEPGGTAGMPVLDILRKEGLSNLIVVVTRYFGGTLLGTGGLVHAYSKSAKAGLEAAGLLDMILCRELSLTCEYTLWGTLQNYLSKREQILQGEAQYTEKVCLPLYLPVAMADSFCKDVVNHLNGQIEIAQGDTRYCSRPRV